MLSLTINKKNKSRITVHLITLIHFCPIAQHSRAALMTLAWEVQLARAFGWWAVDVSGYLPREQHDKMGVELKPAVSPNQYHHL